MSLFGMYVNTVRMDEICPARDGICRPPAHRTGYYQSAYHAAKYLPGAHSIVAHIHARDKEVIVCVQDFGISEKDAANIFNRFYRVVGLLPGYSGLGIGLYISSEIIKRHSGRIWAESKEREGDVLIFFAAHPAKMAVVKILLLHKGLILNIM